MQKITSSQDFTVNANLVEKCHQVAIFHYNEYGWPRNNKKLRMFFLLETDCIYGGDMDGLVGKGIIDASVDLLMQHKDAYINYIIT